MVFPPTAPWWSAGLDNAARQYRAFRWTASGGMQDLGTLGGDERGLWTFLPMAPWWSATLNAAGHRRAFRWTASGGMQDLGTLGGRESDAYGVSADGSVVVGGAYKTPQGSGVPFAGRRLVGCKTSARWAAVIARLMVFPPTAPWWSAGLTTPQGIGVPFAGRRLVGMQDLGTLGGDWSEAYGVSADGSVVVGWAQNAAGQRRAFRWTAAGGMEDLNTTYASLLTNGSVLWEAHAISPDGRYIVGYGYNAATGRYEAFLLDTGFPRRGDVDRNGCVDDADLLQVLFAFGGRGYRNEDLNWDGTVDDADLLQVLFNFGGGC
jgi:probable HAF family extracellular repeat protein